jgi:hypothetical protein
MAKRPTINDFNWEFKLKNYHQTKSKHTPQIRKLKANKVRYSDVMDRYAEDMITSDIYSSTAWQYRYRSKTKPSKTLVRSIKVWVNGQTYRTIQKGLEYAGYPKSWTTAFYITYKKRIDAMMKRVAKELYRLAVR